MKPHPTSKPSSVKTVKFDLTDKRIEGQLLKIRKKQRGVYEQIIKLLENFECKVAGRTWEELAHQRGSKTGIALSITNETTPEGHRLWKARLTRKARLYVYRDNDKMVAFKIDLEHKAS